MATKTEWEARQLGIHDAGRSLARIVKDLDEAPGVVSVQRYGKPVLAIMTWDDYEGLMETLEILKDTELMESFRRAVEQYEAGGGRDFEEFAAELGI